MSDVRKPDEVYLKHVVDNTYNKTGIDFTVTVELFAAHHWADKWSPGSERFFPKAPLESGARLKYWKEMFRVRVMGCWVKPFAKYQFFTREQIGEMIMNINPNNLPVRKQEDEDDF